MKRALHCDTPPMVIDAAVSEVAQKIADRKVWGHSDRSDRNGYGENLAWNTEETIERAIEKGLQQFYEEIEYYNWKNPSFDGLDDQAVGHFTQMVWTTSLKLGVGYTKFAMNGWDGWLMVFHYDPTGNWSGKFGEAVKPLKSIDNCGITTTPTTTTPTTTVTKETTTTPTTTITKRTERTTKERTKRTTTKTTKVTTTTTTTTKKPTTTTTTTKKTVTTPTTTKSTTTTTTTTTKKPTTTPTKTTTTKVTTTTTTTKKLTTTTANTTPTTTTKKPNTTTTTKKTTTPATTTKKTITQPKKRVKALSVGFKLKMLFSAVFQSNDSLQSQKLFNVVRQAILNSLGELRNRFTVRLVGFKKGSVVVETELIPVDSSDSESAQLIEVNKVQQTLKSSAFAASFKSEVAAQKVDGDDNFPEVDEKTIDVKGVVEAETEGIVSFFK